MQRTTSTPPATSSGKSRRKRVARQKAAKPSRNGDAAIEHVAVASIRPSPEISNTTKSSTRWGPDDRACLSHITREIDDTFTKLNLAEQDKETF
jgi:hypothetical protein